MKLCLSIFLFFGIYSANGQVYLKNVSYAPGQKLFVALAGHDIGAPVKIGAYDASGKPLAGISVTFELIEKPAKSKGAAILTSQTVTNADGIAETNFVLGDQAGDYIIIARAPDSAGETPHVTARAQRSLWWMFLIFGLFGGMGIFLYGMKLSSNGLQKIAGSRLRGILSSVTRNRFLGLLFGIFVTAILQSSTATSVMVVGLVSSGLMALSQAIGVLMGAHIGTTITVQLIAFNISDYSLLLVAAGFITTIMTHRKMHTYIGEAVLGFGFILFGIAVMSQAISPLKTMPAFAEWLITFGQKPFLGLAFSILFTAMIHSSGATIGLCVVLAGEGLISLTSAIPIVLGANVGTCITALMASIGSGTDGKRAAFAYTFFSIAGVLIFLPFLAAFESLVRAVTEWGGTLEPARQIANAHMLFNIINAGVLIGFVPLVAKALIRWVPDAPVAAEFRTKYLNNAYLETPEVALEQAHLESQRLITLAREMYVFIPELFGPKHADTLEIMRLKAGQVNFLEKEIRLYLTRLFQKSISLFQSRRLMRILLTADDLRHISERISDNIGDLSEKMASGGLKFSDQGWQELTAFHGLIQKSLETTLESLSKEDALMAEAILAGKRETVREEIRLRQTHIERLSRGLTETIHSSTIHLDLLTALKRIDTFCVKIAHEITDQFKL